MSLVSIVALLKSIALYLYFGSCGVSFVANRILNIMFKRRLKREGYVRVKKPKTLGQHLIVILALAFVNMLPILNVLSIRDGIKDREKVYEEMKRDLLKNGIISLQKPQEDVEILDSEILATLLTTRILSDAPSGEIASGRIVVTRGVPEANMTVIDCEHIEGVPFEQMTMDEKIDFFNRLREKITDHAGGMSRPIIDCEHIEGVPFEKMSIDERLVFLRTQRKRIAGDIEESVAPEGQTEEDFHI